MIGIGKTHGKIILIGEHSVVYGHPCLALPFFEATVTATTTTASEHQTIHCDFYNGYVETLPELMTGLKQVIQHTLQKLNHQTTPFTITIESTIPIERGMGSSAAVAGAIVRSLYHFFQQPLSQQTLLELINVSETVTHGKPSGIDALTTSSNQALYFIKGQQPQWIDLDLDATLIIADTGIMGKTKEAVQHISQHLHQYEPIINHLATLTTEAMQAIEHKQLQSLGCIMNDAHHCLQQLNVSSPELDHMVQLANQNGALGSKLTGGGRGGCMIALCHHKDKEQIIHALTPLASHVWSMTLKGENK